MEGENVAVNDKSAKLSALHRMDKIEIAPPKTGRLSLQKIFFVAV